MAVNAGGKSRWKFGSILVGEGPSDGGGGTIGNTATPVTIKGFTAFTATINAAALSGASLSFTTTLSQSATLTIGGTNVNPGGTTAGTTTPTDVVVVAGDAIVAIPPASMIATGLVWNAYVSAANTVKLVITNPTGGTLALPAGQWTFLVIKLISG